ncbi:fimbrial protein [Salmonella enterica subsp. enterica]|nr:fimbrial protein [Salmonella enterica subsp. enterica]
MFTATRAIRSLSADLAVGKTSTGDSLLGSTGTYGVSLSRNNSMKPGNLGYTPVFSGIANGPLKGDPDPERQDAVLGDDAVRAVLRHGCAAVQQRGRDDDGHRG